MVQQAAALAANLAAQVHRWAEFRSTLRPHANGDVKALVLRALALGWSEKWRTRVIQLLASLSPDAGGCSPSPSSPISPSATRSIAWHPVRLDRPDADVDRRTAARRRPRRLRRRHPAVHRAGGACRSASVVGRCCCSPRLSRRRWRGSFTRSCSTACSRSAICCITSGGSSGGPRRRPAARARGRQRAGRPRHRSDGRRRVPARGRREPQREPDRRLREPGVLVRARAGCPDSCCSRSSARWTRWSATRRRAICASAGAARGWTT